MSINEIVCEYITLKWLFPWLKEGKSQNSFADAHNISEGSVRKMKKNKGYRIPLETLHKICESRDIKLSDFFEEVEKWNKSIKR